MLTPKQTRMLEILDNQVKRCEDCSLCVGGKVIPSWHQNSRYCIIGEAPGQYEVQQQMPLVGGAGQVLTNELGDLGFKKSDFLILNSVQCRPINYKDKPDERQLGLCQKWIRKYLKVLRPEKILCLGNYAKWYFTRSFTGIMRDRGVWRFYNSDLTLGDFDGVTSLEYNVLFTVHPAFCIYNEEGSELLHKDLLLFKNTKFERTFYSDREFSEEEFMLK